ncbi:RES family NAD+ phosphorylase [Methylocystis sp. Sn-Cys]|uniref:RES family NAD+ phosphorylase n=1 Tax=Methylocystis sp. Sn-Cys TaxID=1701263 RepID=UPI001920A817|nr:RES family NAD+ phosphorylase [Methylocystis sp. Sn-Cys]MBL1258868.1 RES family NAD+ phosphorylase [Methylocystis sp. Sn-Cys]
MNVWRICRKPFADLSGDGARLHGGRWNSPGWPVVYTAETAALAVLEVRVHLDLDWTVLPDDYVLMEIDLPDDLSRQEIGDIPTNPIAVGDSWLASGASALLKVPSFIIPESANILINVAHPNAARAATAAIRPFSFDERLWRPR